MARYINTPKTSLKGINSELVKIEDAFKDVLDRRGDGANFLDTDLDMNSQRILNLPEPVYSQEPVRLGDVKPFIDDTKTARDAAVEAAGVAQESEEQAAVSAGQAASSAEQSATSAANSAAKAKDLTEITSALLISQGLSGEYGFFEKGFTYNSEGDVGIDSDGNIWTYNGALPFEVEEATVPSEPTYSKYNLSKNYTQRVQNIDDLKALETDSSMVGNRIKVNEYHSGTGYGAGEWEVVTGETPNDINIINSNYNSNYCYKLVDEDGISCRAYGCFTNGVTDDSARLLVADSLSTDKTLLIEGSLLFTSPNLYNTKNYKFAPDAKIVDIRGEQIVMVDKLSGAVIGLQHNHTLDDETTLGSNAKQTSGNINEAPLANVPYDSGVDVMAYWYQDFGIDYTREGNGGNGSLTWYYWDWNFPTNTGDGVTSPAYNRDRRPLLGYYRGDDVNVLDWQAYWLASYGVTGFIPQIRSSADRSEWTGLTSTWSNPSDVNHWMYLLFNECKNFKKLKYTSWTFSGFLSDTPENRQFYTDAWSELINNVYLKYDNFHYVEKDGEIFPTLFLFEGNSLRTTFGNNSAASDELVKDFLVSMAELFKAAGYGGMCLLCRNPTERFVGDSYLESKGVIYCEAEYSDAFSNGDITNYGERFVDGLSFNESDRTRYVANTVTSRQHIYPHPSTSFNSAGNTPELFSESVTKSLKQINETSAAKVLTIYNVSEWAEGGAALQPNSESGFSYLEALSSGIRNASKKEIAEVGSASYFWKSAAAGTERVGNLSHKWAKVLKVFSDFNNDSHQSPDTTPYILPANDGDKCLIQVIPKLGSYSMRFIDESNYTGTGVKVDHLGGANGELILAPYQTAEFIYDSELNLWVCVNTTGSVA